MQQLVKQMGGLPGGGGGKRRGGQGKLAGKAGGFGRLLGG
jgi:hypothetical protein